LTEKEFLLNGLANSFGRFFATNYYNFYHRPGEEWKDDCITASSTLIVILSISLKLPKLVFGFDNEEAMDLSH
jgi:hypothetical protein